MQSGRMPKPIGARMSDSAAEARGQALSLSEGLDSSDGRVALRNFSGLNAAIPALCGAYIGEILSFYLPARANSAPTAG